MALWSWRTRPDGVVEVDKGDGFRVFRLEAGQDVLARVLDWSGLASKYAAKHGVPLSWILGTMYAESGGDPRAENACCVGLLAIYVKGPHPAHPSKTREQMLDPNQNLDYGTSLLAKSIAAGYDLPRTASIHVAGGGASYKPHSGTCKSAMAHPEFPGGSPWGLCEHMFPQTWSDGSVGYIDRVVRANNSAIEALARKPRNRHPPSPMSPRFTHPLALLVPMAVGVAAGYSAVWMAQRLALR